MNCGSLNSEDQMMMKPKVMDGCGKFYVCLVWGTVYRK